MASAAALIPDSPDRLGIGSQSRDAPESAPPDVQPSADTRYILTEIGKLSVKVDRLVTDVDTLDTKVDAIRGQVRFVQGAAWIIGILVVVVGPVVGLIVTGKITINFH